VQVSDTTDEKSFRTVLGGVIHRIPGAAQPGVTLEMDLGYAPFVRLLVINGNNPPLNIRGIGMRWVRRVLYFHPKTVESYSIYLGNREVSAPVYETAHLIPNDARLLRTLQPWSISRLEANPIYSPPADPAETQRLQGRALNALVVVLLVGLALWGVLILKRLPKPQ
jgi:hypothetical protein